MSWRPISHSCLLLSLRLHPYRKPCIRSRCSFMRFGRTNTPHSVQRDRTPTVIGAEPWTVYWWVCIPASVGKVFPHSGQGCAGCGAAGRVPGDFDLRAPSFFGICRGLPVRRTPLGLRLFFPPRVPGFGLPPPNERLELLPPEVRSRCLIAGPRNCSSSWSVANSMLHCSERPCSRCSVGSSPKDH